MRKKVMLVQRILDGSYDRDLASRGTNQITEGSEEGVQNKHVSQHVGKRISDCFSLKLMPDYEEPQQPQICLGNQDSGHAKSPEKIKLSIQKVCSKSSQGSKLKRTDSITSKKSFRDSKIHLLSSFGNSFYPKNPSLRIKCDKLKPIQKLSIRKAKSQESKIIENLRLDWVNKKQTKDMQLKLNKSRSYCRHNMLKNYNKNKIEPLRTDPIDTFTVLKLDYNIMGTKKNCLNVVNIFLKEETRKKSIESVHENRSKSLKRNKQDNPIHYKHLSNGPNIQKSKENPIKLKINDYTPILNKMNIHNLNLYKEITNKNEQPPLPHKKPQELPLLVSNLGLKYIRTHQNQYQHKIR